MRLRFSETDINYWANRYTQYQTADNREREEYLINLQDEIKEGRHLTQAELHTLAR